MHTIDGNTLRHTFNCGLRAVLLLFDLDRQYQQSMKLLSFSRKRAEYSWLLSFLAECVSVKEFTRIASRLIAPICALYGLLNCITTALIFYGQCCGLRLSFALEIPFNDSRLESVSLFLRKSSWKRKLWVAGRSDELRQHRIILKVRVIDCVDW